MAAKHKLHPREGAKKADGSTWKKVPGGLEMLVDIDVAKSLLLLLDFLPAMEEFRQGPNLIGIRLLSEFNRIKSELLNLSSGSPK